MPKITSVETQKKNQKHFNIFLDGKFAFGADEDLIVNLRLVPGKEINAEALDNILFEAQVGKLMEKMYNLFSFRQRSEKEVRDKLRAKSYDLRIKGKEEISEIVIESLIKKLKQKGLINDEEFAKTWAESRRKSKQKSLLAIKTELSQKGISREIIEEVLIPSNNESEERLALLALEKKLHRWQKLPAIKIKQKAYELLARRGFDYSVISSVVAKKLQKE